jgi:acetoin utilization deacetylase AcuC-like enzyme
VTTAYITHPSCGLHDMGAHHPECPARLDAISDRLIASGLDAVVVPYTARAATREELLRVHSEAYVDAIEAASPESGLAYLDPDTAMCPDSLDAARHAAGAVVHAVDLVMRGECSNAFCAVRPPGHHAESSRAMGFCVYNSIAVAAMHALEAHGLSRVAIVDFDVHHGNGTEDILAGDERVLMVGIFQHPLYPYTGAVPKGENMLNLPLAPYTRGAQVRELIEQHWMPALEEFRPQMIFVSAGFDAHRDDELAQLGLVEADYAWITRRIKDVALRHAQGRIVSCLEGGYNLGALARSVAAHLRVLAGLHA